MNSSSMKEDRLMASRGLGGSLGFRVQGKRERELWLQDFRPSESRGSSNERSGLGVR